MRLLNQKKIVIWCSQTQWIVITTMLNYKTCSVTTSGANHYTNELSWNWKRRVKHHWNLTEEVDIWLFKWKWSLLCRTSSTFQTPASLRFYHKLWNRRDAVWDDEMCSKKKIKSQATGSRVQQTAFTLKDVCISRTQCHTLNRKKETYTKSHTHTHTPLRFWANLHSSSGGNKNPHSIFRIKSK